MKRLILILALLTTVSWTQEARTCLYKNTIFIGCYDQSGKITVLFTGPDAAYKLRPGDVLRLTQGGEVVGEAVVRRPVRLALIRTP